MSCVARRPLRVNLMVSAALMLPMLGAFGVPAYAQSASEGIETVTVTAEKRTENVQSVGMSISAFSGDQLEQNNITSVAQLASFVPSLQITQANNNRNSQIVIRNVGTSGTNPGTEPDVGVFLDGVFIPVAGPIYGEITDIATVEVLRGPQGTLYGRNTPVGAINITTRAPTQDTEGMVDVQYGNYGETRATGFFGGGLGADLAGRMSFWTDNNDGYMKNLYTDSNVDSSDQYGARGRLRWTPDADTSVDVIGYYGHIHAQNNSGQQIDPLGAGGIVAGYKSCYPCTLANSPFVAAQKLNNPLHPYVIPGTWQVNSADSAPDDTTTWGVSAAVNRNIPMFDATLTDILAYNSYLDFAPNQGPGSLPLDIATNLQRTLIGSTSNELRLVSNGTHFIDYVAGVYLFHDDINYNTTLTIDPGANRDWPASTGGGGLMHPGDSSATHFDQHTSAAAVYGQGTVHITDDLRLLGGLRYSYDQKGSGIVSLLTNIEGNTVDGPAHAQYAPGALQGYRADHSLTYMYGGQYDVMKDVMAYFTVSTGFKDGGFNSRSATALPYSFNPESSQNYELGAKTEWFENRLVLNLDVYRMLVHGYQQSTLLPTGTGFVINNAGNFRTQGVEMDLEAKPLDPLTINGALSFADSVITGGDTGAQCDTNYPYAGSNPPPSSGPYTNASHTTCNFDGLTLPYAPKWHWSLGARWEQQWMKSPFSWYLQGDVSAMSGQFEDPSLDPRAWQAGYALFDASVGIEPDSGRWRLDLWGKNLTDKHYFSTEAAQTQAANVSGGGTAAANGFIGWPGIPRTFGIEGSYRF